MHTRRRRPGAPPPRSRRRPRARGAPRGPRPDAGPDRAPDAAAADGRRVETRRRLYAALDGDPDFFAPHAAVRDRSWMNVSFTLRDRRLEPTLLAQAEAAGLIGLGGHRSVGGLRASLYNAVSLEAVDALIGFLEDFRRRYR